MYNIAVADDNVRQFQGSLSPQSDVFTVPCSHFCLQEINGYMEKHNIQIRGAQDNKKEEAESEDKKASSGVLVSAENT